MEGLTASQQLWVERLQSKEYDQAHLISSSASSTDVQRLVNQVEQLDKACPGGVKSYLERARHLLAEAKDGVNPFEGCTPTVPSGESLVAGTDRFAELEQIGAEQLPLACFVLVAGGLGERLGYPDIKIVLPSEISTGTTYCELYCRQILAFQAYATRNLRKSVVLPLAIMTSDDTHNRTVDFLESNNYFGLKKDQVTIVKQEKVPALIDNDAHIAVNEKDPFMIETKPHGHGDVHILLTQSGLPKKWTEMGFKWLVFFQDTNGLIFRCIPAVLGVSAERDFTMNIVAVPRKPGEAMGGIASLRRSDGTSMTINVEYNQLEPLLLNTGEKKGDVPDSQGYSRFPGNTNAFVVHIPRYSEFLQKSGGVVPEFVNPKYADASKMKFKSPTRLECMMQDIAKMLPHDKVGFTQMDRWLCFSTVKNNLIDAAVKSKQRIAPECAFSGEADQYSTAAHLLELAATSAGCIVDIPRPVPKTIEGVEYQLGPKVVLMPSFGITLEEMKKHFSKSKGKKLSLAINSSLVLDGNVNLAGLEVEGSLVVRGKEGDGVTIENLKVQNDGWEVKVLSEEEKLNAPPHLRIRGYSVVKRDTSVVSA